MATHQTRVMQVTAIQWTGDNANALAALGMAVSVNESTVWDQAEQHWEDMPVGSWIITSEAAPGLLEIIPDNIFQLAFEVV